MDSAGLIHPLSLNIGAYLAIAAIVLGMLATSSFVTVWRGYALKDMALAALICTISALALMPSLQHAADLRTSPDSVEYAVGALNIFSHGRYEITVAGQAFPPRYPIGFSLFVVLPSIILGGPGSLGIGVWGVAFLAALGVGAAYLAARKLWSMSAGLLASAVVLLLPGYTGGAQEVLSFAPTAALGLGVFAFIVAGPQGGTARWLAAGLATMVAAACRPLCAVLLIPIVVAWWYERPRRGFGLLTAILPTAAWGLVTGWYDAAVFGDPMRTGYHLWCPIPYDYPQLLLSVGYLVDNLPPLLASGAPFVLLVAALGAVSLRARSLQAAPLGAICIAIIVAAVVPLQFHLLYFYPWMPYFLFSSAILSPLAACALAWLVERALSTGVVLIAIVALALGALGASAISRSGPYRQAAQSEQLAVLESVAERLRSERDTDVVIITGRNLAHVEAATGAIALPISRRVEYASKVLAPQRIALGNISGIVPTDHRNIRLLKGGAVEAVEGTVLDDPGFVAKLLSKGMPVLLDITSLSTDERAAVLDRFEVEALGSGVGKVKSVRAS